MVQRGRADQQHDILHKGCPNPAHLCAYESGTPCCSVTAEARDLVGRRGLPPPLPDDEGLRAGEPGLSRAARLRLKPLTLPLGLLPVTVDCSAASWGRFLGCSRSRILLVQGDGERDAGEVGDRRKLESPPGDDGGELPHTSGTLLSCSGGGLARGSLQGLYREASWGAREEAGAGLDGGEGQGVLKEME